MVAAGGPGDCFENSDSAQLARTASDAFSPIVVAARGQGDCYDELWTQLSKRHGKQTGTRAMIGVLALGQEFGHDRLHAAVALALSHGACGVAAVRYLLTEASLHKAEPEPIDVGALVRYDRPLPDLADYDTLLSAPCAGRA